MNLLPDFSPAESIDLVLNGYEWSAEAARRPWPRAIPYYAYRLRLIVHKGSPIRGTGATSDSPALERRRPQGLCRRPLRCNRTSANVPVEALSPPWKQHGRHGPASPRAKLEAIVQDQPVVSWYMNRKNLFPTLKVVGEASRSCRSQFLRASSFAAKDKTLQGDKLSNEAILAGLKDGSLREGIYRQVRAVGRRPGRS